ncbi:MAG TPA: HEAT repeat domain-containing protein [Verrucomicrobiae bacterium]
MTLSTVAAVVILCAPIIGFAQQEPEYRGRKLSDWLLGYTQGSLDGPEFQIAEEAVLRIGTNGIPTILRLLETPARSWNFAGMQAFVIAKSNLASAVPELARLSERTSVADTMIAVAGALQNLGEYGKDAAPAILRGLKHPDREVRSSAVGALVQIRGDAKVVVPALTAVLRDPAADIKDYVLTALAQYGAEARSALPEVLAIYHRAGANVKMDSDPRWSADLAIWAIAPEEATGVVRVEEEEEVILGFATAAELYVDFGFKDTAMTHFGNESAVIRWGRRGVPPFEEAGRRFEFYRTSGERGRFWRSEFHIEEWTRNAKVPFDFGPSIRYSLSGGSLLLCARDPNGTALKIRQVRQDRWGDLGREDSAE